MSLGAHGVKGKGVNGVDGVLAALVLEAVAFEGKFPLLRFRAGVNVLYRHAALDRAEGVAWGGQWGV